MRRRTKDFGHLKLIFAFLFISIIIPNILNALNSSAADNLGSFEAGETGIKLCAQIDAGPEDSLRFLVTNDQGFSSDVVVAKDTCQKIKTEAATYTVKQYLSQEYTLESVSGGTVSADNTPFIATAAGQYSIIYSNEYTAKGYLHVAGYTSTNIPGTGGGGQGGGDEDPCESNLLYRHIECLAKEHNVIDSDLNYRDTIHMDNPSEMGVNTLAETKDFNYPVYYYRGAGVNQHVLWADKCWTILRTTDTGGVKLEYGYEARTVNGVQTCEHNYRYYNGQRYADDLNTVFQNDDEDHSWKYDTDSGSYQAFDSDTYLTPANGGYMYGEIMTYDWKRIYANETYTFSNDVSYENGVYTLTGDSITSSPTSEIETAVKANHHYFCLDGATSCSTIAYIVELNVGNPDYMTMSYFPFSGPANIEAAKDAMFANVHDSNAKTIIDGWFQEHLVTRLNELEDTPFCNDRQMFAGTLASKDMSNPTYDDYPSLNNNFPDYGSSFFMGAQAYYEEFSIANYRPNLGCDNVRDTFTVSDQIGNGKLTYPVALATGTERLLNGTGFDSYYHPDDAVNTSGTTMTPLMISDTDWNSLGGGVYMDEGSSSTTAQQSNWYYPVVSLKYGAVISGGTGSLADPYVIQ